jgi:ABC-type glycerol-3-phosphate transport system substrate-binding protein
MTQHPRNRGAHRSAATDRHRAAAAVVAACAVLAGCSTQLVDASGERGGGGLAFVVMAVFFWAFFGALFYMDRVRSRRERDADRT